MKLTVLFIFYLGITCSAVEANRVRRFVGGNSAEHGQFPYMVSLRYKYNGRHFCGGSIIHKNYILTAAHCLENKSPKNIYVVAGTNSVHSWRKRYFVHKYAIHSNYDDENVVNDIAIIKLKKNIKFSKYIQKIPLYKLEAPSGTKMLISGWGYEYSQGDNSPILQYSNVTSISLVECRKKIRQIVKDHYITRKHICTYDSPRIGFCDGDSGSPLVYKGQQVGIVSWAIDCAIGYPDVYVKVSSYINWIQSTKKKLNKEQNYLRYVHV